jgi:hypothetical protein
VANLTPVGAQLLKPIEIAFGSFVLEEIHAQAVATFALEIL